MNDKCKKIIKDMICFDNNIGLLETINNLPFVEKVLNDHGYFLKETDLDKYIFSNKLEDIIIQIKENELFDKEYELVYPNYTNSSVNMISSIKAHFGYRSKYNTLDILDDKIRGKHIFVVLLDGLGIDIINKHLDDDGFLKRNILTKVNAPFPPTTVASTTSVLTGLTPSENGWFGWNQYFEEEKCEVELFTNKAHYSDRTFSYNVATKHIPYKLFTSDMENIKTIIHMDVIKKDQYSLDDLLADLIKDQEIEENTYSYAYYTEPDSLMHEFGPSSNRVYSLLREYDKKFEEFKKLLNNDVTLIITADHGQLDVLKIDLRMFVEVTKYFTREPSLEGRCMSFFVNDREKFRESFNKYFKSYFMLLSHEEIVEKEFFGPKTIYEEKYIGDFVAIAINKYYFSYEANDFSFKGHHAGLTKKEMEIPIILYKNEEA